MCIDCIEFHDAVIYKHISVHEVSAHVNMCIVQCEQALVNTQLHAAVFSFIVHVCMFGSVEPCVHVSICSFPEAKPHLNVDVTDAGPCYKNRSNMSSKIVYFDTGCFPLDKQINRTGPTNLLCFGEWQLKSRF